VDKDFIVIQEGIYELFQIQLISFIFIMKDSISLIL